MGTYKILDVLLLLTDKHEMKNTVFFVRIACYVAIDLVWNKYVVNRIKRFQHKLLWEYVLRTVIVLITCKFFANKKY